MIYFGKNLLLVIVYLLFPILVIATTPKMRDSLKKELKEKSSGWWSANTN